MERGGSVIGWHRWLALGVGPAVLLWCLSGLVMLWVSYPSVTEPEWFASAGALDPESCCATLERILDAVDRPQGIESLRIVLVGGRPVAVAQYLDGSVGAAWGDTLEPVAPFPVAEAQRAVEAIAPGRAILSIESIEDDVWTVHQRFNAHRPLWRVSLSGAEAPVRYLSGATGELVQETTAHERRWNLAGAAVHWWYLPWLRRQWVLWDQVLWWVGGAATVMMAAGSMLLAKALTREGGWRFVTGGRAFHRMLGLVGGVAAFVWMVSGWFSMDHGRVFSEGKIAAVERERAMGGRLTARDVESRAAEWEEAVKAGPAKELRVSKLAGEVYAITRESADRQSMVLLSGAGESASQLFPESLVRSAVGAMLGSAEGLTARTLTAEMRRNGSAIVDAGMVPVVEVQREGTDARWVDVDARTGAVLEQQDSSRRLYHRLFDGLHRWDVPWLVGHEESRRFLMGLWCLLGAGLTVSGLWSWVRRP